MKIQCSIFTERASIELIDATGAVDVTALHRDLVVVKFTQTDRACVTVKELDVTAFGCKCVLQSSTETCVAWSLLAHTGSRVVMTAASRPSGPVALAVSALVLTLISPTVGLSNKL